MKLCNWMTMLALGTALTAGMAMADAGDGTRGGRGAGRVRNDKRPTAPVTPPLDPSARREAAIERRNTHQARRIDEGIKHGQLTGDEVAQLQSQETNIQTMEKSFESDGKVTRDEAQKLRKALNDASLQIWGQRHDTEGNQKPVSRLGKDVIANPTLTGEIEAGTLTRPQARQFLQDFHTMVSLKRQLSSATLTADQRAQLQTQYNDLLNKYFLMK